MMYIYAWMKFVEYAPERYDACMNFLTGGILSKAKNEIADFIPRNSKVLDLGCGTSSLGIKIVQNNSQVTGIDSSEKMLAIAEKNAVKHHITPEELILIHAGITQIKELFNDNSFDIITATLSLGEFPKEYLTFILEQCFRILKPGGRLIIADEVWPENWWGKILNGLIIGLIWLPQYLIIRRVCYPIRNMKEIILKSGFKLESVKKFGFKTFLMVHAVKEPS